MNPKCRLIDKIAINNSLAALKKNFKAKSLMKGSIDQSVAGSSSKKDTKMS